VDRVRLGIDLTLFDNSLAAVTDMLTRLMGAVNVGLASMQFGGNIAAIEATKASAVAMLDVAHDRYKALDTTWNKLRSFSTEHDRGTVAHLFGDSMKRLEFRFLEWRGMVLSVGPGNVAIPAVLLNEFAGTRGVVVNFGRQAAGTLSLPPPAPPPPPADWDGEGGDDFFFGLREAATADDD
jgi:hypothetical protein